MAYDTASLKVTDRSGDDWTLSGGHNQILSISQTDFQANMIDR